MAVLSSDYVSQVKALLPPGPAWPRGDAASLFAMFIEVWASEFARTHERIEVLLDEADPRKTLECFEEWLDEWGIPDECLKAWAGITRDSMTVTELRRSLLHKIRTPGGQSAAYFISLAKVFGYTITVEEYTPWHVLRSVNDLFASEDWHYCWRVTSYFEGASNMAYHNTLGSVREPLAWWGDGLIECLITRYKPAHTRVFFAYREVEDL